jgi:progressive ankylosis protein
VIKFLIVVSILPTLLLCILCYTPVGMLYMRVIMGADEALSVATIAVLKFFIIKTLVFPWVDFLNGFLMLNRQTNKMLLAQVGNIIVVIVSLLFFVRISPHLNGINGSIAASLGELAGFIIVSVIIYRMSDRFKDKQILKERR